MDDAPDTTRVNLRRLAESGSASEKTFAKALEALLVAHERREGGARVWRLLGSAAAGLAIAIGTAALSLAWQASADHDRLDRIETDMGANEVRAEANAEATRDRLEEIATRTTRIEVIVQRLERRTE